MTTIKGFSIMAFRNKLLHIVVFVNITCAYAHSQNTPKSTETLVIQLNIGEKFNNDTVNIDINGVRVVKNEIATTNTVDGLTYIGGYLIERNGRYYFRNWIKRSKIKLGNVNPEDIMIRIVVNNKTDDSYVVNPLNGKYVLHYRSYGSRYLMQFIKEPAFD